jgi:regulator of replication initiation timing
LFALLQVLEIQLSAAAEKLAKLQGDMAIQSEELRMVRMEMEVKAAQLHEAEDKLQEQRQAAGKVSQGPIVLGSVRSLYPDKLQAIPPPLMYCRQRRATCLVASASFDLPPCLRQQVCWLQYLVCPGLPSDTQPPGAFLQDFEVRLAAVTAELKGKLRLQGKELSSKADKLRLQGQELREVCAHRDHLNRMLAQTEREMEADAREAQRKLRGMSGKLAAIKVGARECLTDIVSAWRFAGTPARCRPLHGMIDPSVFAGPVSRC